VFVPAVTTHSCLAVKRSWGRRTSPGSTPCSLPDLAVRMAFGAMRRCSPEFMPIDAATFRTSCLVSVRHRSCRGRAPRRPAAARTRGRSGRARAAAARGHAGAPGGGSAAHLRDCATSRRTFPSAAGVPPFRRLRCSGLLRLRPRLPAAERDTKTRAPRHPAIGQRDRSTGDR
jgi:hypothetical protein